MSHPATATRCDAGIVFAMGTEAGGFEARCTDRQEWLAAELPIQQGTLAGRRLAWVVSGAGRERAARACQLLIDGHRPKVICSAGFAGALNEQLRRGQLVHPIKALCHDHDAITLLPWTAAGESAAQTIVTVDRVVCTANEKRSLATATGADLVDMETWAVADVAQRAGLPCASIRVVSDDASQDLPPEMTALVQPQSPARRLGAALRAIGSRPTAAVDMWRLWENAVVDSRTLADAIERFVATLPVSNP